MNTTLKLSGDIIERLRCPRCRASLARESGSFRCTRADCARDYPIRDGVPVLIDDDTSLFDASDIEAPKPGARAALTLKSRLGGTLPSLSKNYQASENYIRLRELIGTQSRTRVLVIGAGMAGAGVDELRKTPGIEIVETDVFIAQSTAAVCDAHALPFADETFDAVVIQAVICYLQDPPRAVAEIHRTLKPQALVYSETPFVQQVSGGRYDFVRFTDVGHRRLFRAFSLEASGPLGGPGMVLAWSWRFFLLSFAESRAARRIMVAIAALTAFWLPLLDRSLIRRRCVIDGASGVYFLGRKSDTVLSDREVVRGYRGCVG